MKMTNKEIYRMVKNSMLKNPDSWEREYCYVTNKEVDMKAWTANGLGFFEFHKMDTERSYMGFREQKIRFSVIQTIILHFIYLWKVRKYPLPLITVLIRYLIAGGLTLGVGGFVMLLLLYINNRSNYTELDLNITKSQKREERLAQLLD